MRCFTVFVPGVRWSQVRVRHESILHLGYVYLYTFGIEIRCTSLTRLQCLVVPSGGTGDDDDDDSGLRYTSTASEDGQSGYMPQPATFLR